VDVRTGDASDVVSLDELAVLLGRPKSTVSAWRRSMELVLDRTIPALLPYPPFDDSPAGREEERAWREAATLVVPEWGACKLPHQQWTHSRKRVIAYRERGGEAVIEALEHFHAWVLRIGERR
jgi:hypothetical protein